MDLKSELKPRIQDVLQNVPGDQINTVIYYAVRLITNRRVIDNIEDGFMVGLPAEPTFEDAEIGVRVIRLIEQDAEMPLQKFDDSQADCYIRLLAQISNEIMMATRPINLERGRALARELIGRTGFQLESDIVRG